jgi:NADH-ubiquinone oxidoreductase chain 4
MGTTDFDALMKTNFNYSTQLFLFYGIFIAFAVKTPTIFLNTWLLKAHVESPLGGSILLAGKIKCNELTTFQKNNNETEI